MRRTGLRMTPGRGSKNWDMGTETAHANTPRTAMPRPAKLRWLYSPRLYSPRLYSPRLYSPRPGGGHELKRRPRSGRSGHTRCILTIMSDANDPQPTWGHRSPIVVLPAASPARRVPARAVRACATVSWRPPEIPEAISPMMGRRGRAHARDNDTGGAFADDQLELMNNLGIRQFFFFGNCIGGPFAMKLMERAPQRVVAALLSQPVGHRPEQPDYMFNSGRDVWAKEFRERRRDVPMETIEKYLHSLYRVQPDFVYSVSRDFAKSCQTPMLVLPDDVTAHPLQVSIDIASLAPNAEITVFPWKDPPELKARTINRARTFLKRHLPA